MPSDRFGGTTLHSPPAICWVDALFEAPLGFSWSDIESEWSHDRFQPRFFELP